MSDAGAGVVERDGLVELVASLPDGDLVNADIGATVLGIGVALAGKLHPSLDFLFNGAWFSATIVAFVVYWLLMRRRAT